MDNISCTVFVAVLLMTMEIGKNQGAVNGLLLTQPLKIGNKGDCRRQKIECALLTTVLKT